MKIAVIGSRTVEIDCLEEYLPRDTDELVSGGAKGIDRCAEEYARKNGIEITVFLPDYARYGRGAPLKRNERIAEYADCGIAFWDGSSRGTKYTVDCFRRLGKPIRVLTRSDADGKWR